MTTVLGRTRLDRQRPLRDSERINRTLAFTVGVGGLGYGLLEIPEIAHQASAAAGWWTAISSVAIFGACAAVAALAQRARLVAMRIALATLAAAPVLACVLFPSAGSFGALDGQSSWVWRLVPIGVLASVLLLRPLGIVAYLVFINAAASAVNCYASGDAGLVDWLQFFVRNSCLSSVYAWVLGSATRAAALLDEVSERAERSAARSAAAAASIRERDRFAALIHDGVLSTLLEASRGRESPGLAEQASRTLAELDEFRLRSADESRFDAPAVIGYLRVAVSRADSRARFSAQRSAKSTGFRMSVADADVIAAALSEAVRNSYRHSGGRQVACEVVVSVGDSGIWVHVVDDGPGFDRADVPPHRLGIAVSIVGRMRALPGGGATVTSAPGRGTTVSLSWERAGA